MPDVVFVLGTVHKLPSKDGSRAVTGNPGNPFPELPDTFSLPDSPGNEFWLSPIPRFPAHHSPIPRTLENFTKKLDNFRKNEQNPKKNKKKCGGNLKNANFSYIHPILVDFLKKYTLIPYIVLKSLV